jgi:hypothetical protein
VVEHLVLATNALAFQLVFVHVLFTWLLRRFGSSEAQSTLAILVLELLWWLPALRHFYSLSWLRTSLGVLALVVLTWPIVLGYRYMLFWVTFWSV